VCALDSAGTISCWGWDTYGQVSGAPSGTGYSLLRGGLYHTCVQDSTGNIECWGKDDDGQVSDAP